MPRFDTVIVVDWSARSRPSPRKPTSNAIWWAAARAGTVQNTVYARTRHAAIAGIADVIAGELDAGRRVLAGFDFPFGYPEGVATQVAGTGSALALWDWLSERIEDDGRNGNNRYAVAAEMAACFPGGIGPFWGRPKVWKCPAVPARAKCRTLAAPPPERRIADAAASGAKTVWQLAYNGSVGSQVLLGLPALNRLRKDARLAGRIAVWPFEGGLRPPEAPAVLAEVYPSLLKDDVAACGDAIVDRAQVRVNAEAFSALAAGNGLAPLFGGPPMLTAAQRRVVETEEGWILGAGWQKALSGALGGEVPVAGSAG